MSADALHVRRLHVQRLYGLDHDGLLAEALAPGVNVVYGPNGQGKTTLGRALHGLVWPDSVRDLGPVITGEFSLGDAGWRVDLDGTAARHEKDGVPTSPPALPGLDERDRYRLSLHDLLRSDGGGFARAVARDAAGGLDLDEATGALGFNSSTPRSSKATAAAADAWSEVEDKLASQAELQAERQQLDVLKGRRDDAAQARIRAEALALAAEHARARAEADEARSVLDALPAALAHVRDDDDETLRTLQARESAASDALRAAAEALGDAQSRLSSNTVEQAGSPAPVDELRELLTTVQEADDVANRKGDDLVGLRRQEAAALASVEGVVDADRLASVDASGLAAIDGYAEEAARLHALRQEHAAVQRVRESASEGAPSDAQTEAATEAARALRDWLRTQRSAPVGTPRTLALVGALASAVGGAVLTVLVHPVALALLVPAALLAAVYVLTRPVSDSRATDAEARYRRADKAAIEWTPDAVEARLARLDSVLARGAVARFAHNYTASWTDRLGDVSAFAARVEARGREVADALGVQPDVRGPALAYAVRAVQTYQDARTRRLAAEDTVSASADRRHTALERAGSLLAPFDVPPPADAAALAQALADLDRASQDAHDARRDRDEAKRQRTRAGADAASAAEEIAALFERVGLDPDEGDDAVAAAVRSRTEYAERSRRVTDAEAQAASALRQLHDHPAYDPDFEALDPATAEQATDDARNDAAAHDDLVRQIAAIETRIEDAEGGHGLEEARARHRAALDDLRAVRDRAADARLGQILADHAARVSRERQVPPVVQRASRLLGRVTAHRYALGFDPARRGFLARDTTLGRSFSLDEVSSGTRVQILLCVRVAFVEHHERGARLPLVLDELLANSDEDRAAAITEAVLALCRDGRQVFYLTSQPDEVDKWRRVAEACDDVECAFVALGPGVGEPDPRAVPPPSLAEAPPAPNGHDHAAYGAALTVPRWSFRDDVGALHLWYAVDQPDALHRALAAGVSRLGPALAAHASGVPFGLDAPTLVRLRVYADALAAYQGGWREGRGQPVLRETIEACPAVSNTFLERVAAYAATHDGDGEALVAGLRAGDVKGFRSDKADEFEAYLLDHGHIDSAPTLSDDDLWTLVVERVGPTCASGDPPLADVRSFLGRVATGPLTVAPSW